MTDYILLMHGDKVDRDTPEDWVTYLAGLTEAGVMRGGSAIGTGECMRRAGAAPLITTHLNGFIRVEARDLEHVRELLAGNPVYEAGGTVEVRELPQTD